MSPSLPHIWRTWVLRPVLIAGLWLVSTIAYAEDPVRFYYFFDPNCHVCEETQANVVDPLLQEFGAQVEITRLNIAETANMELLLQFEEQHGVVAGDIPEVVIGEDILVGAFEIQDRLRDRIEHYLALGGLDLPVVGQVSSDMPTATAKCDECKETHAASRTAIATKQANLVNTPLPATAAPVIHVVYFYQPGCDECERSEHDLRYIEQKYPQVQIERLDVKNEAPLNQYLCQETGVPEDKHLTAPVFFVGNSYLLGDQVRARAIEALITPLLAEGSLAWWVGWEAQAAQVEQSIIQRFQSFGLITVIAAGLLDGINPCAFATMIFLISYLSLNKRKGKELLATGGAFTLGVFLTYLGVGFGVLKFLSSLSFLSTIGKWVYGATAALCLALAWGSIADYRKAREGRLHDMTLRLPDSLREFSKRLIREGTSAKRFVASAFLMGIGVSLVELACTGQVYLPTIIYVLGIPALRAQASLSLVLYNLMFIAPLVGVFILVYYGTTSEQLIEWLTKRAAAVKVGMAVLFVALASWLIYSIIAL